LGYGFREPKVSGGKAEEQVGQILSFLRQHIRELNWAMARLDTGEPAELSEGQKRAVLDAVGQSGEVFGKFCQALGKKQEKENFLGGRKKLWEGSALTAGKSAAVDSGGVLRYSLFLAIAGGVPVVCGREGSTIAGTGVKMTLSGDRLTVVTATGGLTGLYGII